MELMELNELSERQQLIVKGVREGMRSEETTLLDQGWEKGDIEACTHNLAPSGLSAIMISTVLAAVRSGRWRALMRAPSVGGFLPGAEIQPASAASRTLRRDRRPGRRRCWG